MSSWSPIESTAPDASIDPASAALLWAESGCGWLTERALGVPLAVVRRAIGLTEALDEVGAGLADITVAPGLGLLAERAASMGLPPAGAVSAGGATRFVRAVDGWLGLTVARDEDRSMLPAWLEVDDPVEVDAAAAARRVSELRDRAALLGLPCSIVGEVDDPVPVRGTRLGDALPRPLEGAVVINLASLWAGPLCADVLARLGARVIKVESTRRPDGGRLARHFFRALHGRCESVALDLSSATGQRDLARLLGAADVVIEGSRPRALEQMGIDAASVASEGPRVWLSITAHGRTDQAAQRVGFGDDAAAAGGLVGWAEDGPRFVADAVADPLTGLTSALAITRLLDGGGRWLVDVALARVARSVVGEWSPTLHEPARPAVRSDPGRRLRLGRDTDAVLAELA